MRERGVGVRVAQHDLAPTVVEAAHRVAGEKGDLVWTGPLGELLVRPSTVTAAGTPGRVTLGIEVACDQAEKGLVTVAFGIGKGMDVTNLSTPTGPAAVVNGWAEPLVAYLWEVLLRAAQAVSAPHRPATMSAEEATLIVIPA